MTLLFDGRPFNPRDFKDALMAQVVQQLADQLRARIGSIRDPATGEFPTIVVHGSTIDELRLTVEGSDALMAQVKEALADVTAPADEAAEASQETPSMSTPPVVFLSWGSADKDVATRIATAMTANGIETWFSEWEIGPGDSIRQKIDAGLGDCSHFLVLLTPDSVGRPWVNIEIDAGLIQKLDAGRRFIPLRAGVEPKALSPLLRTLHSPEIKDFDRDIRQLINDIYGVTRKPPLGPPPPVIQRGRGGRFSEAASAIARYLVERSEHGEHGDPTVKLSDLAQEISLTEDDTKDGVFELGDVLKLTDKFSGMAPTVGATPALFAEFDKYWLEWKPHDDALRVAAELVNDPQFPRALSEIAQHLDWSPRRLNPAIAYLKRRDLVRVSEELSSCPFIARSIDTTDHTRRFVNSRS